MAKDIGKAHEYSNYTDDEALAFESAMDLFNNSIGRLDGENSAFRTAAQWSTILSHPTAQETYGCGGQ